MRFAAALCIVVVGAFVAGYARDRINDKPVPIPPAAPGKSQSAPRVVKDNVVAFETRDPKIAAAKQKARATLPRFRELAARHTPGTYTVKFPLTQNGETEHIWLQLTGDRGSEFIGRLANDPVNGSKYRRGQQMTVPVSEVEDWMITDGSVIYGGYTARVGLAELPKDKQAKYAGMFRD